MTNVTFQMRRRASARYFPIFVFLISRLQNVATLDPTFGFHSGAMTSRRRLQSASTICNETKNQVMNGTTQESFEWECTCTEVANVLDGSSGAYHMTCTSTCGQFCNRKNDVCLIPGFIQGFDSNGVNYLFSQTYQYTLGRQEYIDRRVFFNLEGSPLSCSYGIDDSTCQSCEIIPCTSGGAPIELNCENLIEGATFDFCANPTPAVEEGVFQFLNPEDFLYCSPLLPPTSSQQQTTSPPILSPTIRPMMGKVVPEDTEASSPCAIHGTFHLLASLLFIFAFSAC